MKSPEDAEKMMRKYGIPLPCQKIVKSSREALKFADKIGYPVVMKVSSSVISHKTESGGVFIGVVRGRVEKFFRKIMRIKGAEGVLVQKQVEGIETIAGGIRDSQFGPCVSFGTGGIFVEVLKDVNFRVCPITKKDARDMVRETKIYRILEGYRGRTYDTDGLVEALLRVSRLMVNEKIRELDINPLICSEKGVWAADVRMS
ncbi:MAG: acetate--CoA ligase family protein [archaeon]|nr:MAG: acetate--CoA ligase family protein [archaeon]